MSGKRKEKEYARREERAVALKTRKGKNWMLVVVPVVLLIIAIAVALVLNTHLKTARRNQAALESELALQREKIQTLLLEARNKEVEKENSVVHEAEPIITDSLISDQLDTIKELVTAEYIYTNAGQYENNKQMKIIKWDIDIPFTSKHFIVAYDGCIKAGVDLSKAEIAVDEENHTISITLPKSEIISHQTFEDTLVVLDERDGVFNKITIENYNGFVSTQKDNMEKKAIERGILESARTEAEEIIKAFLSKLPGMDTYTLTIK